MHEKIKIIPQQLKETCKLTHSSWAIWIAKEGEAWNFRYRYGLSKHRLRTLQSLISDSKLTSCIVGSFATGRPRSYKTGEWEAALGCRSIFIFPSPGSASALVVGADALEKSSKAFFRVLAWGGIPHTNVEISVEQVLTDILDDLDAGASYDLRSVLRRVLQMLTRYIPCEEACVGLRYGAYLRLEAILPLDSSTLGRQISIDAGILPEIISERKVVNVADTSVDQTCPLLSYPRSGSGSWLGVPLNIGKRVIGVIGFFSEQINAFTPEIVQQATIVSAHMAPAIETSMALAEATLHLEKLALLNELASSASVGIDADEVAMRIVQRLKRIFNTELVSILWLSSDGETLHEFGESFPGVSPLTISVQESLLGYVVETGLPMRIGDVKQAPRYLEIISDVLSELAVPLKYRGKVIGVLDLESKEPDAFSLKDEQLLVVMASQLAGLIENVRLNDETRRRARSLELIHQVVQEIVGLTDIAEIAQSTAELLTERFAFELSLISLVGEFGDCLVIEGVGRNVSSEIVRGLKMPLDEGIAGQVCNDGRSRLINDTSLEPAYIHLPGWQGGSEMCVPLRDGMFVVGVVIVEASQKNAFTENDLLVLEALAGVLSSVMIHARSYQQLQMRLRHLQAVRETALDIGADLDLKTLLERVTLRARELVGAKGAELGLVNEENQTVEIQVSINPWEGYSKGLVLSFNQGVAGHMAVEGKTLVVDDYDSWAGRLQLGSPAPFEAVAGVPLKYKGKVIGTLTISHDKPGLGFDTEDIRLLELLAPQVAVSVRNARLYQELQKLMEAERLAKDHLVRSARLAAIGELAAGVAHELNNPLTTVAGFVELVLDDLSPESPHRPDLELVLKEARRAKEVVRRLLDFSRPGEGFRVLADINDLVSDVISLIRHLVHTSGIDLKIDSCDDLPWIHVDRDQIKQVLLNLIHNAIQAMPRGGLLSISTALESRDDIDGVMVMVKDTGQGIHAENIDRLFEPFFTTRPPGKGTGLGLSVSYGIVTDHGGTIDVESKVGLGSSFTIWLPLESNKVLL